MSKIAIISQPDQGVFIDLGGCSSLQEALEHLSSTLQSSNKFWKGSRVILGMGNIALNQAQAAQVLAIAKGVGVFPEEIYSKNEKTRDAFSENNVKASSVKPMNLPKVNLEIPKDQIPEAEAEEGRAAEVTSVSVVELEHETMEESTAELEEKLPESKDGTKEDTATAIQKLPQVLYVKQTLRSGQTVSHKGDLVIVGDVNPGAEIMAEGDITVWGSLRGIAHAGIGGNTEAEIRALNLQPIQIRIAHAIARSPDRKRITYANGTGPETARIFEGKIRITKNKFD
ncbi:MAG TPA: septum site-determining protein MinC [Candidatus Obscuribacter sp.]|nr:septum site-determining protein MinC [Candidatus Obscuribacter sp.]HMX45240.1 septum site-determining protein MinC [Candidatus Obscuribacter sp.]HMY51883.1 septum site-determining protein MinC [Candidatus Obscuribacter sp.]HNB15128.1 septum site-determining protein MinC [Candidatus Obscuribacter sp.]HND05771.1 septum site-determining protein MinC [Candidatus Obscuribacter sp.]